MAPTLSNCNLCKAAASICSGPLVDQQRKRSMLNALPEYAMCNTGGLRLPSCRLVSIGKKLTMNRHTLTSSESFSLCRTFIQHLCRCPLREHVTIMPLLLLLQQPHNLGLRTSMLSKRTGSIMSSWRHSMRSQSTAGVRLLIAAKVYGWHITHEPKKKHKSRSIAYRLVP